MNFMISWFGQVGVKIYYIRRKKNPIPRSQLKYSAYAPGVFDLHYFRIRVVAKGKNFNRKFIIFKMAGWIFPIFCMKLDIIKGKNFTKGNFPKIFGSSIKYKIVHFWGVFCNFLINYMEYFDNFLSECSPDRYQSCAKNQFKKSFSVLKIIIHKVRNLVINGQSRV